jgi:hypothetical protein
MYDDGKLQIRKRASYFVTLGLSGHVIGIDKADESQDGCSILFSGSLASAARIRLYCDLISIPSYDMKDN